MNNNRENAWNCFRIREISFGERSFCREVSLYTCSIKVCGCVSQWLIGWFIDWLSKCVCVCVCVCSNYTNGIHIKHGQLNTQMARLYTIKKHHQYVIICNIIMNIWDVIDKFVSTCSCFYILYIRMRWQTLITETGGSAHTVEIYTHKLIHMISLSVCVVTLSLITEDDLVMALNTLLLSF